MTFAKLHSVLWHYLVVVVILLCHWTSHQLEPVSVQYLSICRGIACLLPFANKMTCCTWSNWNIISHMWSELELEMNGTATTLFVMLWLLMITLSLSLSVLALGQPRTEDPVWSMVTGCCSCVWCWELTVCSNLTKPSISELFSFAIPLLTLNSTRNHVNCNMKNIVNRYTRQKMPYMSKESKLMVSDDCVDVQEHNLCITSGIWDEVGPQYSKYASLTLRVDKW